MSSELTDKDLEQLSARGSSVEEVQRQLSNFRTGFAPAALVRAATAGDGLVQLDDAAVDALGAAFDAKREDKSISVVKFVPASGAASRMFKDLFTALNAFKNDSDALEQLDSGKLKAAADFIAGIEKFAFKDVLDAAITATDSTKTLASVLEKRDYAALFGALLSDNGLSYGSQPKGLLLFHRYEDGPRTPLEEHLVEAAQYASVDGRAQLHFTVSPAHQAGFEARFAAVREKVEKEMSVKFDVSYSVQKTSTDTIAVTPENELFRLDDGSLLFRPAGHGALIENLDEIKADVVFIKNIDNVVPDAHKLTTQRYKKALGGVLLREQARVAELIKQIEDKKDGAVDDAAKYLRSTLGYEASADATVDAAFVLARLRRPLRVCGMVKNTGEPGGGPFWVRSPSDGSVTLQVVESAQMDTSKEDQAKIMKGATHFNPVDLVCSAKRADGQGYYSLLEHRDLAAGFIADKSLDGRKLRAQELPGLWNGAMADWNTVFVEVELATFNPVKMCNDLLRPMHQPKE